MTAKLSDFRTCEICRTLGWQVVYQERIHDSSFGMYKEDGLVAYSAGAETLPGIDPIADSFWKDYLEHNGQTHTLCMKL